MFVLITYTSLTFWVTFLYNQQLLIIFAYSAPKPATIQLQAQKANEWHSVCLTHDSSNGHTKLFWHGQEKDRYILSPKRGMEKNGNISFGGGAVKDGNNPPISISQVNLWDRILSKDEFTTFSRRSKCDGNAGNILDWFDFKNHVSDKTEFAKTEPSQCINNSDYLGE